VATDWQGRAFSWLRYRDATHDLPVEEEKSVQLSRGNAVWTSLWACGRDVLLGRSACQARLSLQVLPEPEWIVALLPDKLRNSYFFNGYEAKDGDLLVSTQRRGFITTSQNRSGYAIALKRARLMATCSALRGSNLEESDLTDAVISLNESQHQSLLTALSSLMNHSFENPIGAARYGLSEVVENDFYDRMAHLLLPCLVTPTQSTRPLAKALHVVAKAAAVDHNVMVPPSIADMCAAAGVGEAWLHKCFVEVYGTSPARYLLLRRLSKSRERLLDRENPPLSVKDIAIPLGFIEGGRFAQRYKSLFGELPSETLRRTHASASHEPDEHQMSLLRAQ
jgi:AraC-like DNA-binding protein